jgi:hypothetical protein
MEALKHELENHKSIESRTVDRANNPSYLGRRERRSLLLRSNVRLFHSGRAFPGDQRSVEADVITELVGAVVMASPVVLASVPASQDKHAVVFHFELHVFEGACRAAEP